MVHHCPWLSQQLLKTQFKHQAEGGCPPFPSHNLSQVHHPRQPLAGTLWTMVQADMQELRRECCLARAMEIQSLELLQQEHQIRGKILKGVFATAYTQNPAGNCSSQCWKPQRASWEEACTKESRDQLTGRPEGHRKGHGMGKEKEACVFNGLEEAGSLSCSQTTRQAAATTRSWTELAREQAPWLQEHNGGEASEGHSRWSVGSTQHQCPESCLCLQPFHIVCSSAPPAHPLWGLSPRVTGPCKSVGTEAAQGNHASPALSIPCLC